MNTATLSPDEKTRSRGRPREFDMDAALDKALYVFSERGYHAASISDLSEAMGLASGSVYKAFKDKRGVFIAAFDRYRASRKELLGSKLGKCETGRDKLRALLAYYASSSHGEAGRRGCLVVGSANDLALFDDEAAARVAKAFVENEQVLADIVRLGQTDGSICADIDATTTAQALLCLTNGMRVVGKMGRTEQDMAAVADTAMKLVT